MNNGDVQILTNHLTDGSVTYDVAFKATLDDNTEARVRIAALSISHAHRIARELLNGASYAEIDGAVQP